MAPLVSVGEEDRSREEYDEISHCGDLFPVWAEIPGNRYAEGWQYISAVGDKVRAFVPERDPIADQEEENKQLREEFNEALDAHPELKDELDQAYIDFLRVCTPRETSMSLMARLNGEESPRLRVQEAIVFATVLINNQIEVTSKKVESPSSGSTESKQDGPAQKTTRKSTAKRLGAVIEKDS